MQETFQFHHEYVSDQVKLYATRRDPCEQHQRWTKGTSVGSVVPVLVPSVLDKRLVCLFEKVYTLTYDCSSKNTESSRSLLHKHLDGKDFFRIFMRFKKKGDVVMLPKVLLA